MTTQSSTTSDTNRPTHLIKLRHGKGENARFEKVGAAWKRENGTIYCQMAGSQVLGKGFYLFPAKDFSAEVGQ